MADVDLLALERWGAATGALRREGFRDVEAADHACAFRDPDTGGILELHHSVCSCPFRVRWEMATGRRRERLWRTVAPAPSEPVSRVERVRRAAVRGVALARRWGPEGFR